MKGLREALQVAFLGGRNGILEPEEYHLEVRCSQRSLVGWLWERLGRAITLPQRKVFRKGPHNFEELTTVLMDVEDVVNLRPLTYVESDSGEPGALTRADLIVGRRLSMLPRGINEGQWN